MLNLRYPGIGTLLFLLLAATQPAACSEPFVLGSRAFSIPESGEATQTLLCTAKTDFALLPPTGWKAGLDTNETKATWLAPDYSSTITIRLLSRSEGTTIELNPARIKETILQNFSNAKIVDEPICYSGLGKVPAFDFEYLAGNNFKRASRLAQVSTPEGVVEISLATSPEKFSKLLYHFNLLLGSFQVAPRQSKP